MADNETFIIEGAKARDILTKLRQNEWNSKESFSFGGPEDITTYWNACEYCGGRKDEEGHKPDCSLNEDIAYLTGVIYPEAAILAIGPPSAGVEKPLELSCRDLVAWKRSPLW